MLLYYLVTKGGQQTNLYLAFLNPRLCRYVCYYVGRLHIVLVDVWLYSWAGINSEACKEFIFSSKLICLWREETREFSGFRDECRCCLWKNGFGWWFGIMIGFFFNVFEVFFKGKYWRYRNTPLTLQSLLLQEKNLNWNYTKWHTCLHFILFQSKTIPCCFS